MFLSVAFLISPPAYVVVTERFDHMAFTGGCFPPVTPPYRALHSISRSSSKHIKFSYLHGESQAMREGLRVRVASCTTQVGGGYKERQRATCNPRPKPSRFCRAFAKHRRSYDFMKKAMIVMMFVFAVAGLALAQNWSSTVDVLGAHQNQGRGCAGCHAPHSGSFGSGHGGVADAGSYALWGQDASPLYGQVGCVRR